MADFEKTVEKITEEFGARGFTAKKTAAADILKDDIDITDDTSRRLFTLISILSVKI